jgi:hypothetical protein
MSSKSAIHVLAFVESFTIVAYYSLLYRPLVELGRGRGKEDFHLLMYMARCQRDIKGIKTSPTDICRKLMGAR